MPVHTCPIYDYIFPFPVLMILSNFYVLYRRCPTQLASLSTWFPPGEDPTVLGIFNCSAVKLASGLQVCLLLPCTI